MNAVRHAAARSAAASAVRACLTRCMCAAISVEVYRPVAVPLYPATPYRVLAWVASRAGALSVKGGGPSPAPGDRDRGDGAWARPQDGGGEQNMQYWLRNWNCLSSSWVFLSAARRTW